MHNSRSTNTETNEKTGLYHLMIRFSVLSVYRCERHKVIQKSGDIFPLFLTLVVDGCV